MLAIGNKHSFALNQVAIPAGVYWLLSISVISPVALIDCRLICLGLVILAKTYKDLIVCIDWSANCLSLLPMNIFLRTVSLNSTFLVFLKWLRILVFHWVKWLKVISMLRLTVLQLLGLFQDFIELVLFEQKLCLHWGLRVHCDIWLLFHKRTAIFWIFLITYKFFVIEHLVFSCGECI